MKTIHFFSTNSIWTSMISKSSFSIRFDSIWNRFSFSVWNGIKAFWLNSMRFLSTSSIIWNFVFEINITKQRQWGSMTLKHNKKKRFDFVSTFSAVHVFNFNWFKTIISRICVSLKSVRSNIWHICHFWLVRQTITKSKIISHDVYKRKLWEKANRLKELKNRRFVVFV